MAILIIRKRKLIVIETPTSPPPETGKPQTPLDGMAEYLIEKFPNLLVAWYLMASLGYYEHNLSLVSDGFYDEICKTLAHHWDDIEHKHKHLIDFEALNAGTGYYISAENAPLSLQAALAHLVRVEWGVRLPYPA